MSIEFSSDMTVELVNSMGNDSSIVQAARVSTIGKNDGVELGEKGLINYLMKNRHGSPFEHNSFTFYISTPIFVFREFHRHRVGWSYNEESGRYKELAPKFYVPASSRKLQQVGKPGHYIFEEGTPSQKILTTQALSRVAEHAYAVYEEMLDTGVAREVARMCLPLNIYSSMYATCNARSLMHFLSLRTERPDATFVSHPQYEIDMVASKMEGLFQDRMPLTWGSWVLNGRVSP